MKGPITTPRGAGAGRRQVRILFSCAGRRIELIQTFVRAARALKLEIGLHVADTEAHFAASCITPFVHRVPPTRSADYIPALLRIARREKIDLLVPLLDTELLKLSLAREDFAQIGCGVLVSSPRVVRTCRDKLAMYQFLIQHGIDTPTTWRPEAILPRSRHPFPYFLKPRCGSASKGNHVIRNKADLEAMAARVPDAIVQEFVSGIEHTLDVYAGYDGRPRCVVPRERLEIRGGEVTKARTVEHEGIIQVGAKVVEALADCRGLITIQLILTPDGRIRVIEVNPRFGGGVPLAIHAGADFPRWLLMEWLGRHPRIRLDHFEDGVMMLRYHQSFFKTGLPAPQAQTSRRRGRRSTS